MVVERVRRAISIFLVVSALATISACSGGAPSIGNREGFKPPDDECWPRVESCHDSYPICPMYCR
jgi:hypothetical protein